MQTALGPRPTTGRGLSGLNGSSAVTSAAETSATVTTAEAKEADNGNSRPESPEQNKSSEGDIAAKLQQVLQQQKVRKIIKIQLLCKIKATPKQYFF